MSTRTEDSPLAKPRTMPRSRYAGPRINYPPEPWLVEHKGGDEIVRAERIGVYVVITSREHAPFHEWEQWKPLCFRTTIYDTRIPGLLQDIFDEYHQAWPEACERGLEIATQVRAGDVPRNLSMDFDGLNTHDCPQCQVPVANIPIDHFPFCTQEHQEIWDESKYEAGKQLDDYTDGLRDAASY